MAGFGNGNIIALTLTFTGYVYNTNTGILTVNLLGKLNVQFDIRTGYVTSGFRTNAILGILLGNQIWYNNAPPNPAPADCSCKPFPSPPVDPMTPHCAECTEYTTTFTTIDTDGATTTQTGDVIITIDSDGGYTTTTSIIT